MEGGCAGGKPPCSLEDGVRDGVFVAAASGGETWLCAARIAGEKAGKQAETGRDLALRLRASREEAGKQAEPG